MYLEDVYKYLLDELVKFRNYNIFNRDFMGINFFLKEFLFNYYVIAWITFFVEDDFFVDFFKGGGGWRFFIYF